MRPLLTSSGEVRLADFELSKRVGDAGASITTTGTVVGSPAYMSPEAINGEAVGLSGDVWSFGVLLCEVLAGHLPFRGSVAGQMWAGALRDARSERSSQSKVINSNVLLSMMTSPTENPMWMSLMRFEYIASARPRMPLQT